MVMQQYSNQTPKPVPWELLAPPRCHLQLSENEKGFSQTLWIQSIAPRWRGVLTRLILDTVKIREDRLRACSSLDDDFESRIDVLVMALIELWYAILFCKVSSHNASELLKRVVESCFHELKSSRRQQEDHKNMNDIKLPSSETNVAISGQKQQDSKALSSEQSTSVPSINVVCESTELKTAVMDSLRWAIEYAFEGLDRLTTSQESQEVSNAHQPSSSSSTSKSAGGTSGHQGTSSSNSKHSQSIYNPSAGQATNAVPQNQVTTSQVYLRIRSVLEAVEKSGILTKPEIIGTIPYTQLDQLPYIRSKDGSNLLKVNVRMRTKELFTLQVFNLESENPCGYAQLHVLIQTFLVYATSVDSRKCCMYTSRNANSQSPSTRTETTTKTHDPNIPNGIINNNNKDIPTFNELINKHDGWGGECSVSDCSCLAWLETGIYDLITEFSLCVNRVIEILLIYWQHWLFVLKHEVLRIIKRLISKEKLHEVS